MISRVKNKFLESFILISVLIVAFIFYLFQDYLSYFDELLAFIFSLIIVYKLGNQSVIYLYKEEKLIVLFLVLLGIIGLLSNYFTLSKNPTQNIAIISDFIVIFKAYIVYFGIRLIKEQIDSEKIIIKLTSIAEVIFYLLFVLVLFDLLFDIFPKEPRYGMQSLKLFFGHPSRFSFAFGFIFMILFHRHINSKKWLLLMVLLVGILSLRVKFFGFVLIAFLIFNFRSYLKRIPRKQILIYIFLLFTSFYFIFKDRISMYFSWENITNGWSRGVLLIKSIYIANDFFPFGTGFGTYAGYFSGKYYSWVYPMYGLDQVWGITRDNYDFIADQFWPMILGQFGWFGLILYTAILYCFIMLFVKLLKMNSEKIISQRMIVPILGIFMLIIDSTSDAIFTQDRAVAIFILIALIVNMQSLQKIKI